MDAYQDDPRLPVAATCPRCAHPAYAGTGGWSTCRCGRSWAVHPAEVADVVEPLDRLDGAALSVDRLRAYLHGPTTAAERAAARRRLDQLADRW